MFDWLKGFANVNDRTKRCAYLKLIRDQEEAARPKLPTDGAKKLLEFVAAEAANMLSNDVDGEGYSSFRSGLMVVYYTALPDCEDGFARDNKLALLNAPFHKYLCQIYKNAMNSLNASIEQHSFSYTVGRSMDSLFKMLPSVIEDCKDEEAGVDLCHQLLERTKLMQTVFEDWCSPHFEEGNIAVQWKNQPHDLQYYALEILCCFLEQVDGRKELKLRETCKLRINSVLDLAASARSGAISERCIKLLGILARQVDEGYRNLVGSNPVEEALKVWLASPANKRGGKPVAKGEIASMLKAFKELYSAGDESGNILTFKDLSQDKNLHAVYSRMIQLGRGSLEEIKVKSIQISSGEQAQKWRVAKGKIEVTHDSVSLLLCDMEDEEEVDTNVLHIPIDNIVEMTVPEEGLCCEIKFSNDLISGNFEHALAKASQ